MRSVALTNYCRAKPPKGPKALDTVLLTGSFNDRHVEDGPMKCAGAESGKKSWFVYTYGVMLTPIEFDIVTHGP